MQVETGRAAVERGSKAVVDVIAVALGVEATLLRHRRLPVGGPERDRWRGVWEASGGG